MMKKLQKITLLTALTLLTNLASAQGTVHIPDTTFKAALLANTEINTNDDDEIQVSEAEAYNSIIQVDQAGFGEPQIHDLTGLEAFINVKTISFKRQPVGEIDLSSLSALRIIDISYTGIATLDVSSNANLVKITAVGCYLTDLDISNNPNIEYVNVSETKILEATFVSQSLETLYIINNAYVEFGETIYDRTYHDMTLLDVSGAPNLKVLKATHNGLPNIDLSANTELVEVDLSDNSLAGEVDLSANTKLEELKIKNTSITGLDVSNSSQLHTLIAFNTELMSLDLSGNPELVTIDLDYSNSLEDLNLKNGGHENLEHFSAYQTELICVEVDDPGHFEDNFPRSYLTYSTNCEDEQQDIVYIPDPDFKAFLVSSDDNTNDDNEIQRVEAEAWSGRIVANHGQIEDFTGIEAFVNTTELLINNHPADSINLSTLTKLRLFSAFNTGLTSLDVSNNPKLATLNVVGTTITSIDLSNNPNLVELELHQNALKYIDLSAGSKLDRVQLNNNFLDSIKVGNQPSLRRLALSNNNLTSLDASGATSIERITANNNDLETITLPERPIQGVILANNNFTTFEPEANIGVLDLANNDLTSLDFSGMTALHYLIVRNNDLTYLNIKNGNEDLDYLEAYNNELTCITVNDVGFAHAHWSDDVDEGAGFSTDCSTGVEEPEVVEIPDANFKTALLADTNININGDDEIQVAEAEGFTGTVSARGENVADLTGIEAFVNIVNLYVDQNNITSVDISANTKLEELLLDNNNISAVDLTNNPDLTGFYAANNQLTSIDFSNNKKLQAIRIYSNQIDSLVVEDIPNLTQLFAGGNELSGIALNNLPNLERLYIASNNLVELDLSGFSSLREIYVNNNELEVLNVKGVHPPFTDLNAKNNAPGLCIEIDYPNTADNYWEDDIDEDARLAVDCSVPDGPVVIFTDSNLKAALVDTWYINLNSDDEIQVFEAEEFTGQLIAINSNITSTGGIEAFINVTTIKVQHNQLSNIDVSSNTKLKKLHVQGNSLTTLDLAANTELDLVRAQDNQLTSLDLSAQGRLEYLETQNNALTSLNIHNGNNEEIYQFDATGNPNLTCVEVDDPSTFEAQWGDNVNSEASFSTDCGGGSARMAKPSNLFKGSEWEVYPNPTSGMVNISQLESFDLVEIYDLSGLKANVSIEDGQLDLSDLNIGTYVLKATRDGHTRVRRIVKTK